MNEIEINKTIAEFMCWEFVREDSDGFVWRENYGNSSYSSKYKYDKNTPIEYTKSLDALVPVWDKLKIEMRLRINTIESSINECVVINSIDDRYLINQYGETLQEAAAKATVKAIKALSQPS